MLASSTEYLRVGVTSDQPVASAEIAFVKRVTDEPVWTSASYASGVARVLVGPADGDVELGRGIWLVLIRLQLPDERPVLQAGKLTIS